MLLGECDGGGKGGGGACGAICVVRARVEWNFRSPVATEGCCWEVVEVLKMVELLGGGGGVGGVGGGSVGGRNVNLVHSGSASGRGRGPVGRQRR